MPFSLRPLQSILFFSLSFSSFFAVSGHLNDAISIETATNRAAVKSQKRIDGLSDKTHKMLDKYRTASHKRESLAVYNSHLKDLVDSQEKEKISLNQQLAEIEKTQHEIVPLILQMLESLEQFIALDMPFLAEERHQRLEKLKLMMVRADVTHAEKYRRILEAYQIEKDYGNTIEAYRADIEIAGVISSVDFLRLGRVTLYYQRFDGSESGFWNKKTKQWQVLDEQHRYAIREGLRVARKETAPNLLRLPIPTAEAGQ